MFSAVCEKPYVRYFFYNPSIIPTPCTANATIHAVAHCTATIPAAALTVPISRRTVAIAATQGVYQMKEISFETYKARERTIEKLEDELELAEEALENKYGIDD